MLFSYLIVCTQFCFQAHNDRSRDYTVPDTGILAMPQAPGLPSASAGWQPSPQAASMYVGNEYAVGARAPVHNGQMPTWDPSMQGGAYVSPSTYPGPVSRYPTSAAISNAPAESLQASQSMPPYGMPPNAQPHAASASRPPYYPS